MLPIFQALEVETVNACNRDCWFCKFGQPREKEAVRFMRWELIERIVDDLHGLGGALADAVGIEGATVPAHHGERGMLGQPGRYRSRRALREEVDHPVRGQIDQDRAVAVAAPPGPLVHAHGLEGGGHGRGHRPYQPQQSSRTDRQAQPRGGSGVPASFLSSEPPGQNSRAR